MSVAIEHVDDAAERLGTTVAKIHAAITAGELQRRTSLPDYLSVAEVTAWGRDRGLIADAPVPAAPQATSEAPPAIDPILRAEYERTARALGVGVDEVLANARNGEQRSGRRTVAHVDYRPQAATRDPAFVELEVPASAGMRRKDAPRPLPSSVSDTGTPRTISAPGLEASDVAGNVPPLIGGRRRAKVAIDYPNKLEAPE